MAWRASFEILREIFPQVDVRIVKGAALDHRDDIESAADFILNEVLVPEDSTLVEQQLRGWLTQHETTHSGGVSAAEVCASPASDEGRSKGADQMIVNARERECVMKTAGTPFVDGHQEVDDASASYVHIHPDTNHSGGVLGAEVCALPARDGGPSKGGDQMMVNAGEREWVMKTASIPFVDGHQEGDDATASYVHIHPDNDRSSSMKLQDSHVSEFAVEEVSCLTEEVQCAFGKESVGSSSGYDGSVTDEVNVKVEEVLIEDQEQAETVTHSEHVMDLAASQYHAEEDGVMLDNTTFSGLILEASFTSVNTDEAEWESVQESSIHIVPMETLDDIVQQSKRDKEVLVASIEGMRNLRLKADQAELAARRAKHEAARGGMDILARVDEMRAILIRAQEANATIAGEVYGEKAVLATEARELQSRLLKLNVERETALSVLNEINQTLEARIESANRERIAAEQEKLEKEAQAREALSKEEALMAKVAQESRDLEAEAEACSKLQDFLVEGGRIVDSLQGEVAVLCEDAEALRKDLEGVLHSCGGAYVHMFSRTASESSNGCTSIKFGELRSQQLDSLLHCGSESYKGRELASNSGLSSSSVSVSSRNPSGTIAGSATSPLPEPKMCNSSQPSHSLNASVTRGNSVRELVTLLDEGQDSGLRGGVSNSNLSLSDAERESYKAHMMMLGGGNLGLEYAGPENLDIFRYEKQDSSKSGSDDEGWHLLDMAMASHSCQESSESCSSPKSDK